MARTAKQVVPMQAQVSASPIAEFSETAAGLARLREKYAGVTYDMALPDEDSRARAARRELVGLRVDIEAKRKQLKAPLLERGKMIDDEAKRITAELCALEDPIDAQIKADEAIKEAARQERQRLEQERQAVIMQRIDALRRIPFEQEKRDWASVRDSIVELTMLELTPDDFGIHLGIAELAKQDALSLLQQMYEDAVERDRREDELRRERAELERQREEQRLLDEIAAEERRIANEEAAAERGRLMREAAEKRDAEAKAMQEANDNFLQAQKEANAKLLAGQRQLEADAAELRRAQAADEQRAMEAAAAERARIEAESIKTISLLAAATDAVVFLSAMNYSEHIVTRRLIAAIARAKPKHQSLEGHATIRVPMIARGPNEP